MYTDAGFPVVAVDYWSSNPQCDVIVADCFGEGVAAADLLVRHGHTRIFYMGNKHIYAPEIQNEPDAELLLAGFQRGLQLAHQPPLPPQHVQFFGFEQVDEAVRWFRAINPQPTAGLIFSDALAAEFIRKMRQHGVRCPEDMSIVTKSFLGSACQITCLRTDPYKQGEMAADCLLERASEKRDIAVRIAIPSVLDRGRTVSFPPAR